MQAIVTKYLGATNYRGSRVKATCEAGSLTRSWDDALDPEQNHDAAAVALADKLGWREGWHGDMVRGCLPGGRGNAYVFRGHIGAETVSAKKGSKGKGRGQ